MTLSTYSQASGFLDYVANGVDTRTGQYTLGINLPELQSNDLSGPGYSLALKYNPLNIRDSGFGKGWNLNLTEFTPPNGILSLNTGESFKQTSVMPDGTPVFKENKLDTFHFKDNRDGSYRLAHKTGLVEILRTVGSGKDQVAVPHEIYLPSGHSIHLVYGDLAGWQTLQRITNADGTSTLLSIERNPSGTVVRIHLRPYEGADGGPVATYTLNVDGEELTEIILPSAEQPSWRLKYEVIRGARCVTEVDTPTGAHEVVEYLDDGHIIPGTPVRPNLPRVTRHITDPGCGLPPIEVAYRYESTEANQGNNFLGNGAATSLVEGMDPLFDVAHTYTYGTTTELMDDVLVDGEVKRLAVRSIIRTFNRFHSLTEEMTVQNGCIKREVTTYYAEDKPFDAQPVQFQMPRQVKTIWQMNGSGDYREELTSSTYDTHGNQIEKIDADGRKTVYTFYPKEGADGCPQDPENFERNLKALTVIPSPKGQVGAPTLKTVYRYQRLEPLTGSVMPGQLLISSETLLHVAETDGQDVELRQVLNDYNVDTNDALLLGRVCRHRETINGNTTTTTFQYRTLVSALAGEPVLETIETVFGFDHVDGSHEVKKAIPRQDSLITGLPVLTSDENNVQTLTRYDALRRVTSETVAPGDKDYEATRTYEYALVSTVGQHAWQTVTDINEVKVLTRFDGLNRRIYEARLDPDRKLADDDYLQIYAADYDAKGNLISQIDTDWLGDIPLPLVTRFEYDDWGEQNRVKGPDGVTTVSDLSPFGKEGPISRSWQESADQPPIISGLSVTESNRFGKPLSVTRYDAQPVNERLRASQAQVRPLDVITHVKAALAKRELPIVGSTECVYNGLGSCVEQTELLDDDLERVTTFDYDAWGRMVHSTLPDQTQVHRAYAEHVSGELPISLRVEPANTSKPTVVVGEQAYDGLLRQTRLSVGGRVEQYEYEGGEMRISKRTSPSNQSFKYAYKLQLSEQPVSIDTPDGQFSYDYDPTTASLKNAGNNQGTQGYTYNAAGQLLSESWTDPDGTHEMTFVSSLQGRPQRRSQAVGPDTVYDYDECGRAKSVTQGELRAEFRYNLQGQQCRITTQNLYSLSTLITDIEYDSLGREVLRTLTLTGATVQTIAQTWTADDQLKTRHRKTGSQSQLEETFGYDLRNRLTSHACTGATLPKDVYGNAYTRQTFRFDSLNNVEISQTLFANGQSDLAIYTYSTDDPCQLKQVTHSYTAGGYPATQTFAYDDDGNMVNDEQGQRLVYNSQGRLLEVRNATGTQVLTTYRYNGHQDLIGVRQTGDSSETLRFYEGYHLSHTRQDDRHTHYLFHDNQPLGQQQFKDLVIDHEQTLLLLTDASPSVIGESLQGGVRTAVYSAYGVRSANAEELQSLLAFNGEVREANGWSLLGRGYRVYNPGLMRFHSPDSYSPFRAGGLNPYQYCLGNPVNLRDPSGHASTGRPDRNYIYPVKEILQSFWEKWLPLGGAIISMGFAIAFTPFTGGMSVALVVGVISLLISAASAVVISRAILEKDQELMNIGQWLGYGSAAVGIGAAVTAKVSGHLAALAAKKAAQATVASAGGVVGAVVGAVSLGYAITMAATRPPVTSVPVPPAGVSTTPPPSPITRRWSAPDLRNPAAIPDPDYTPTDTTRRSSLQQDAPRAKVRRNSAPELQTPGSQPMNPGLRTLLDREKAERDQGLPD